MSARWLEQPRATVVVCTRNRSRDLALSLEGALRLSAPFAWELLVVDNQSTDDTVEVARRYAASDGRVRVASEPVVGLSAARNCAVRLARGDWLAFLDDDAVPAAGWLEAYDEAFAGAGVLSAGGPVEPRFVGAAPSWLDPWLLPYVTVWDRGAAPVDLRYNELPRGANVAYRREAFELVGGFDRRLGRAGRSLRSCEETELGLRLERCGFRSVYVPGARVTHRVETSRLTPGWLARRLAAQAFSEAVIDWKHFGRQGLAAGVERQRRYERELTAHLANTELAALSFALGRAYQRGAAYAVLMVERWEPDPSTPHKS